MLYCLRDYAGVKVLRWFIRNPDDKIHVRGLSRELNLNPATVLKYLNIFSDRGILIKEKRANLTEFFLDNRKPAVNEMKKLFILDALVEGGILEWDADIIAVFGSCADGSYRSKSDIDLLVVGGSEIKENTVRKVYEITGMELNSHMFTLEEWLEEREKPFGKRVRENHILIKGDVI